FAITVRVGVLFSGAAMGGPAGVTDSINAGKRLRLDSLFQVAQFAGGTTHFQTFVLRKNGYARRIIPPVLQAAQSIHNNRHRVAAAHIAHNSAHKKEEPPS